MKDGLYLRTGLGLKVFTECKSKSYRSALSLETLFIKPFNSLTNLIESQYIAHPSLLYWRPEQ